MPVPGGSGRVAWWKPATGVGAIVPDGIVGARNEGIPGGGKTESLSNDKEVLVVRAGVGLGADTLTPGEGVWYDAVVNKTTGRPNAVNVTGPGGEPVRQLCPGAAKAAAEAVAAGRAKATTAARLRDGRINASEEARLQGRGSSRGKPGRRWNATPSRARRDGSRGSYAITARRSRGWCGSRARVSEPRGRASASGGRRLDKPGKVSGPIRNGRARRGRRPRPPPTRAPRVPRHVST